MLPTHGRYNYTSINERPFYRWPNGAGLALYFGLGMEHYAFAEGATENIVPGIPSPDVLNTSWREYGNRVGAWRILDLFKSYELPLTVLLNTEVYDHCPGLAEAFHKAGARDCGASADELGFPGWFRRNDGACIHSSGGGTDFQRDKSGPRRLGQPMDC